MPGVGEDVGRQESLHTEGGDHMGVWAPVSSEAAPIIAWQHVPCDPPPPLHMPQKCLRTVFPQERSTRMAGLQHISCQLNAHHWGW